VFSHVGWTGTSIVQMTSLKGENEIFVGESKVSQVDYSLKSTAGHQEGNM
jgi:hypothetical protein